MVKEVQVVDFRMELLARPYAEFSSAFQTLAGRHKAIARLESIGQTSVDQKDLKGDTYPVHVPLLLFIPESKERMPPGELFRWAVRL